MIAYLTIFAAALSGYGSVGIWAIAMTALALVCLSQFEYAGLYKRGQDFGLLEATQSTALQSAMNATVVTTVAYAFGWFLQLT